MTDEIQSTIAFAEAALAQNLNSHTAIQAIIVRLRKALHGDVKCSNCKQRIAECAEPGCTKRLCLECSEMCELCERHFCPDHSITTVNGLVFCDECIPERERRMLRQMEYAEAMRD